MQQINTLTNLAILSILMVGCKTHTPTPQKKCSDGIKSICIESKHYDSGRKTGMNKFFSGRSIYFSNLKHKDIGYDLSAKVPKIFSVDDNISFTINTNGKIRYLYIFYIDSDGQLSLLYPNSQSPLTEICGIYTFPKDFGNMRIKATKDCKDCEKELTKIYILNSREPILDIQDITASQISNIPPYRRTSRATCHGEEYDVNFAVVKFYVQDKE